MVRLALEMKNKTWGEYPSFIGVKRKYESDIVTIKEDNYFM